MTSRIFTNTKRPSHEFSFYDLLTHEKAPRCFVFRGVIRGVGCLRSNTPSRPRWSETRGANEVRRKRRCDTHRYRRCEL